MCFGAQITPGGWPGSRYPGRKSPNITMSFSTQHTHFGGFMSHEDFAAFVGERQIIAGHKADLADGFDAMRILRIDDTIEIPLLFQANEGFESRVERLMAAIERSEASQRSAA